jgi:hypothetical protein
MPKYENKGWEEKRVIGLGHRNTVGHVSKERAIFKEAKNKNARRPHFI